MPATIINEQPGMPQTIYYSNSLDGNFYINRDGYLVSHSWNVLVRYNGPLIVSDRNKNSYRIVFVDGQVRSRERI